jgi:hypothetical protein
LGFTPHGESNIRVYYLFVRVLIRNLTDEFLDRDGHWTNDELEARDFRSTVEGAQYCREHIDERLTLVLKFGDPKFEFQMQYSRKESL